MFVRKILARSDFDNGFRCHLFLGGGRWFGDRKTGKRTPRASGPPTSYFNTLHVVLPKYLLLSMKLNLDLAIAGRRCPK